MLSKQALRDAIRPLFQIDTMPTDDPVGDWCRAYSSYAQSATAGVAALAAPLVAGSASGQFSTALDASIRAMWMSAVWVGPAITAVTSVVPPLMPFLLAVAPTLNVSYDRELGPTLIADALHTYTLSIIVSVVPASGTPVPTPLT